MKTFPFDGERVLLARLDRGDDLLASLQALCETERVEAGVIQAIGAVERAVVGFYDQADGRCVGGHLMPGTRVFACEIHLRAFRGAPPVREPDGPTGLMLW